MSPFSNRHLANAGREPSPHSTASTDDHRASTQRGRGACTPQAYGLEARPAPGAVHGTSPCFALRPRASGRLPAPAKTWTTAPRRPCASALAASEASPPPVLPARRAYAVTPARPTRTPGFLPSAASQAVRRLRRSATPLAPSGAPAPPSPAWDAGSTPPSPCRVPTWTRQRLVCSLSS